MPQHNGTVERHKVNVALIRQLPDGSRASRRTVELWFDTEEEAQAVEHAVMVAVGQEDDEPP